VARWYSPVMSGRADTLIARLFAGLELRSQERRARCEVASLRAPAVRGLHAVRGLADGATGIVLVNGLHARDDDARHPCDEVSLSPSPGGG